MAYKLKKDHLTNWDAQQPNEKFNDHQDDSISERSSVSSLDETSQLPKPMDKQLSPPIARKERHNLQYNYNKLPENGVPLATQVKQAQREDRKRRKNLRKAPPGQGNLVPLPEIKSNEMSENYFPYSRYYKVTNPDYIMRHRQTVDGQLIPYEYIDPSQYAPEPAVATTTSSKKSRRHHRKSHHNSTLIQYNPDKNRYETVQTDFQRTYDQQRSVPKQYIPLKDANNGEYPSQFNTQIQSPRQQYEKSLINNNWNDHYIQSMTSRKSSHDSNTSKHHHSKKMDTILPEVNKNHHHQHHHSSPPSQEQNHHHHHHHHSPSQSQEHHHHHHSPSQSQHHHHHRHRHHHSPTKEYVDSEFQVVDNSFKKSERTAYFQPTQNPFQPTPPAIYNQSSYLPPISPDDYYRPYPADYYRPHKIDYYSTQLFPKDQRDSLKAPKIYRADAQKNFYDRYLNNVITKQVS